MLSKAFLGWGNSFVNSTVELALSTLKKSSKVKLVLPSIAACTDVNAALLKLDHTSIKTYSLNQFLTSLSNKKIANTSIKKICWKSALQKLEATSLKNLFPGECKYTKPNLSEISNLLIAISEIVFTADYTFEKLQEVAAENKFNNQEFWFELSVLCNNYLKALEENGFCDPFYEIVNIRQFNLTNEVIIIAGCQNLTNQACRIIENLAANNEITIAINANEEFKNGFSACGALNIEYWEKLQTTIPTSSIQFCNSNDIECDLAVENIRDSNSTNLVLLDPSTLSFINSKLLFNKIEFENRFPQKIISNRFIRLILLIVNYCSDYSTKNFIRLIREPALRKFFSSDISSQDFIGETNKIIANYFPLKIDLHCQTFSEKLPPYQEKIKFLADVFDKFNAANNLELAISIIVEALKLEPNEQDAKCLSILLENAAKIDAINLTSNETILEKLSELIQTLSFNNILANSSIKILPANEATTSNSEQIIILGATENNFPAKESYLPFLDKQLTKQIAIVDYSIANSSFLVSYITNTKAKLKVLCPRQTMQGEPLIPSRFLFKTDPDDCVKRVIEFTQVDDNHNPETIKTNNLDFALPATQFVKISKISCSSFKDYVTCPYLFYLKHILKIESSIATEQEMGAATFGHLAHKIIERFSKNIKAGQKASAQTFESACTQTYSDYFPWEVYPAVKLQLEQLKYRIQGIVNLQNKLTESNWEIAEIELGFEDRLEDLSLSVTGKIDRVDINIKENSIRVIDFKTSDKVKDFKHIYLEDKWLDLQLPLYANYIGKKYPGMKIEVAYVNLPKQLHSHSISSVPLSLQEIHTAVNQAKLLATQIIANNFAPIAPDSWPYEFRTLFA